MAANLHVALFEHVQEAHLDALGEVWQLVDGEDAPIHPRHEAEVDRELVREIATLGHLDRVHLADEVGDGDVGRRQLLAVALIAVHPADGGFVALLGGDGAALGGDGRERVFGDLGALDDGRELVKQAREAAHDARLRLAALAEQDDVLAAEDGVGDLRQHRLVVADDAGEQGFAGANLGDEVAAHLRLHRQHLEAGCLELAQGFRSRSSGSHRSGCPYVRFAPSPAPSQSVAHPATVAQTRLRVLSGGFAVMEGPWRDGILPSLAHP